MKNPKRKIKEQLHDAIEFLDCCPDSKIGTAWQVHKILTGICDLITTKSELFYLLNDLRFQIEMAYQNPLNQYLHIQNIVKEDE